MAINTKQYENYIYVQENHTNYMKDFLVTCVMGLGKIFF